MTTLKFKKFNVEAYQPGKSSIKKINWADGFFRKDIGWKVIKNK